MLHALKLRKNASVDSALLRCRVVWVQTRGPRNWDAASACFGIEKGMGGLCSWYWKPVVEHAFSLTHSPIHPFRCMG